MRSLSLVVLVAVVSVALAGSVTETFRFSSDAVKLGTEQGYTTVDFAGAPHVEGLGAPDLPALACQVLIPADAEVTGFEVTDVEEEILAGEYDVLPVQHPTPWMENPPQQPFVEPNPQIYGVDAFYPGAAARFGRAGNKSGYRLANFGVYPVRYNPVRRQLSVVKRATVRVVYAEGRRHVPRYTETQIGLHGQHVTNLVLNRGDVRRFAPPKRTESRASAFLPAGDFEHVVITRTRWVDSLTRLVNWRTRQGWRSRIMPIESIGAYPGRDTAEKMRNFIKDADTTWGTVFVFIARDDYPGGAALVRQARAYNYTMKSDMYFTDLDGDWDRNGNSVFGEVADSVDGYADVFVGMITITTGSELSNYLNKLFRYEWTPDTTGNWTTKSLLPNGVTFSNEFNDSIAIASPTPPWFDLKMYTSGGMVTPSPAKYCDSLNSGYSITSVIAHGSPDIYSLGGDVTSPMMLGLTNTNRLNFVTCVCCNTGEWDLGSTNGDCIAENMAFHAPAGFIGVCKNDKSGWVRVAEFYNYSICYGVLGFRTPRRPTQGEALAYGKDYWAWCFDDSAKWRMESFERNLFGEPAVPLWTGPLFVADVSRPGAINIGTGIPVPITVMNGSTPVESTMVCLRKGTETFARGWTDAAGQVILTVSPLTPGMMDLTITCGNHLPHLDSIPVMAAGKFVAYLKSTVDDSAGGNNDGIINPGETVRLPTWVKNYGTQTAYGVNGRLITHAAGVAITDSVKSFGDVGGEDSAYNATGFEMTVANGLPNGYSIPCSLVCKDNLDSSWVSYVTYRVGAPMLQYVDKAVKDSMSSRPNGKLDPGETVDLEVTIKNSGIGNAYNVYTVLRSADTLLTVPDSHAVYGTVLHDSSKCNSADHFTIVSHHSISQINSRVSCTLDVYADGGYVGHEAFEIIVGELRAVDPIPDTGGTAPKYYAYDDGDTGYTETPTFEWVEIRGLGTRLTLSDDQTVPVSLPAGFGPFRFYGQSYSGIAICGNGWVAPGSTTRSSFDNTGLPAPAEPPMLAIVWDDIYPPVGGGVWHYHDAANHRFVVEWDSVAYYADRTTFDKYQIILYDTTTAGRDGNCEFAYQYLTANRYTDCTVGEQDHTKTTYIQVLHNGSYHRGSLPIVAGRAIKFTTDSPEVGIAEQFRPAALAGRRLAVTPSVFLRKTAVHWQLDRDAKVDLAVFDASGRLVRTLVSGAARAGSHSILWDGTDDSGRTLAHGVYFVRMVTPEFTQKVKTILAH